MHGIAMNTTQSIANLAKALALAQREIKPALQDSTNPHFRSKYASLTAIYNACREPLAKNGLSVIQGVVEHEGSTILETMLMHESGEYISAGTRLIIDKGTMQGLGSAITYARRYALATMVGVVADDDDDGNEATQHAPPQSQLVKPMVKPAIAQSFSEVSALMEAAKMSPEALREYTVKAFGKAKSTDLTAPEVEKLLTYLKGLAPVK